MKNFLLTIKRSPSTKKLRDGSSIRLVTSFTIRRAKVFAAVSPKGFNKANRIYLHIISDENLTESILRDIHCLRDSFNNEIEIEEISALGD